MQCSGQASRGGSALLGLVVGVPEVLDVVDQPAKVVIPQPVDAAHGKGGVARRGQGLAVRPRRWGEQQHHDSNADGDPPAAPGSERIWPRPAVGWPLSARNALQTSLATIARGDIAVLGPIKRTIASCRDPTPGWVNGHTPTA